MKIERLTTKHHEALIDSLNTIFSKTNKRSMDFEREMPKLRIRDSKHMGHHIGIFDNGSLLACMGIYPLETRVGGKMLEFATTGNIAVHPDYEGKGYMCAKDISDMYALTVRDVR